MPKKNKDYWEKRFLEIENRGNKRSESAYQNQVYAIKKAEKEIKADIEKWIYRLADNNGLSIFQARHLLSTSELDEFQWTLAEYIKYGEENAVNHSWIKQLENASAKVHIQRLEALRIQINKRLELLAFEQNKLANNFVKSTYKESYFHTAYEIAKGTNKGLMLSGLDEKTLNRAVNTIVAADSRHFSDRIWSNQIKLGNELNQEILKNVMLGKNPKESIQHLTQFVDKKINNAEKRAKCLIYSEHAYYSNLAQKDMFEELGVEYYEIVVTLDTKTSDVCRPFDGRVFHISEFVIGLTAPPFHAYCRSITVPNFDKEDEELGLKGKISEGKRAARDIETEKTYYVPSDITYKEWYNKSVKDSREEIVEEIKNSYNLKIHAGAQGKHIRGHNNYKGKSYLLDDIDPQELINKYATTGELRMNGNGEWTEKEFCYAETPIGYDVNPKNGEEILTRYFSISYSKKKGTHIVPRRESIDD